MVRVISHQDFRQFIHGLISDSGPKFRLIVDNSYAYKTSRAMIQMRIKQDFETLDKAVEKMAGCKDVNDFDQNFDFESAPITDRFQTFFDDTGLDTGVSFYYYRVYVVDASGNRTRSNEVTTEPPPTP